MKSLYSILILLICVSLTNSRIWCEQNSTCVTNLSEKYICNTTKNICEHETLAKFSKRYIIGAILIILISAFANAGGIGGGSVIVPILTIMFLFEVNEAIPLSKATIFAGAVINVFFLLNHRNEHNPNKSLIDYKLCSFMLPIMMCGTFFGVYLNFFFPPMVIIALLTGYLILSILSIYKKFILLSRKEDEKLGITLKSQILQSYENFISKYKTKVSDFFNDENSPNNDNSLDEIPPIEINIINTDLINDQKIAQIDLELTNIETLNSVGTSENAEKKIETDTANSTHNSEKTVTNKSETTDIEIVSKLSKHISKTFSEIISDNLIFILILLSSMFIIVILSLFKEGALFNLGGKVTRCSRLGLFVMLIILFFCLTVSAIAFNFNIKKEKRDVNHSILIGENIPFKVQNDLNKIQNEMLESQKANDELNDSNNTNYLSFRSNSEGLETLTIDSETKESYIGKPVLEIDSYNVHLDLSSKKTQTVKSLDVKSIQSMCSIESIIDEHLKDQKKKLVKLGIVSFFGGIGAGLLGIGGGMIINPFLIIMSYSPLDAMAISSMGVLFTSTISSSEFLIMKAIHFSDLSYFLILAGIGSLSGVFILKQMVDSYQRQSILIMIILGIFMFAVVVLPTFGLLTIPMNQYLKFGSVCG